MIRLSTLVIVLSMFCTVLSAEPINVSSGEHEGFTRLVFEVSSDRDWELQVSGRSAELVIVGDAVLFNGEKVFDRIGKTRLISTSSDNLHGLSIFRMNLACGCSVSAFSYLDTFIVIDISDTEDDESQRSRAVSSLSRSAPQLGWIPSAASKFQPPMLVDFVTPSPPKTLERVYEIAFPPDVSPAHAERSNDSFMPDSLPSVTASDSPEHAEYQEDVEIARLKLLEQLTIAVEQGLIDLSAPVPSIESAAEPVAEEVHPPQPVPLTIVDERQYSITSIYGKTLDGQQGNTGMPADSCIPEEQLDIASWGSGDNFANEISELRVRMLQEFDRANVEDVRQIIQLYIRYGLGIEALSYITEYSQIIPEQEVLRAMAVIVNSAEAALSENAPFDIRCGGAETMWSLLSQTHESDDISVDADLLLTTFSELPLDVRKMLGSQLAKSLEKTGMDDISERILMILERAPGDLGNSILLEQASDAHVRGDVTEANSIYRQIAAENTPATNPALLALADSVFYSVSPIDSEILTDLGAAANASRGTAEGLALRRLEVLMMSNQGAVWDAMNLIELEIDKTPNFATELEDIAGEVLMALPLAADSLTSYPELILAFDHLIGEGADDDRLRQKIASDLIIVGLPGLAIDILKPTVDRSVPEGLQTAATAHLAMFDPENAIQLISDLDGDTVRLLRVEAYLSGGDFESALHELESMSTPNLVTVNAEWYAGDWDVAALQVDAAAQIRASFVEENGEAGLPDMARSYIGEAPRKLSELRTLLGDSAQSSSVYESIIDR